MLWKWFLGGLAALVVMYILLVAFGGGPRSTLVVLSERPISEVRLTLEGRPVETEFDYLEEERMFVWGDLRAGLEWPSLRGRSDSPAIGLTWREADGTRGSFIDYLPQAHAFECVHVVQLGASGEAVPDTGSPAGGNPRSRWANHMCRRPWQYALPRETASSPR